MSGSDAETTSSETIETPDDDSMTPELSSNEVFSLNSTRNLIVNYLPYDYEEEHLEVSLPISMANRSSIRS